MPRTASAIGTRNSLTTSTPTADPAKVTVKVKPGPLYHVASIKVLGPDGQPLSIPLDERKLPLKPGDPARTAPVVATETALLAALGDSGHPFAKVENRRVEIDKRHADDGRDLHARPRAGRCVSVRSRSRGSSGSIPPMSRDASAGSAARSTMRARSKRPAGR